MRRRCRGTGNSGEVSGASAEQASLEPSRWTPRAQTGPGGAWRPSGGYLSLVSPPLTPWVPLMRRNPLSYAAALAVLVVLAGLTRRVVAERAEAQPVEAAALVACAPETGCEP